MRTEKASVVATILNFLRTGKLTVPQDDQAKNDLYEELEYYMLKELAVPPSPSEPTRAPSPPRRGVGRGMARDNPPWWDVTD